MEKIDNILKKAGELNTSSELLSEADIKAIVENLPEKISSGTRYLKYIIPAAALLIVVPLIFMFNYNSNTNNEISKSTPQKIITIPSDDIKGAANEVKVVENNIITESDDKPQTAIIHKLSEIEDNEINKTNGIINSRTLPWNIEGLHVLELTDEEFEKLVPNSRCNDTTFYIYTERLINDEQSFNKFKLQNYGYKLADLPLAYLSQGVYNSSNWSFNSDKVEIYKPEKYKKTIYAAISTSYETLNPGHSMYITGEPLIFDNSADHFFVEYNNFVRTYQAQLFNARKNGNKEEEKKILDKEKDYTNLLFESLIPVKVNILPNQDMIFWFYPNDEFLKALPERYSASLRRELEMKNNYEKNNIDLNDACKGLNTENSVFGLCLLEDGALRFENLYPNPNNEKSKLVFSLTHDRKVTVSLYSLNGNLLNEILHQQSYCAGTYEVLIPLDKLPVDIYMVVLTTDNNEKIIKRLLKF